ncbi:hypothetical protein FGO68_gene17272 [Halteria grandinella]|uniref:Uncharacterized protein n=1 Tax=Halteria grandinella TaxID=5974 RepID=A0A8J8NPR5_HALGN|nr:hypothetical protein FGO68_gene17272 [Halteria grandinella]
MIYFSFHNKQSLQNIKMLSPKVKLLNEQVEQEDTLVAQIVTFVPQFGKKSQYYSDLLKMFETQLPLNECTIFKETDRITKEQYRKIIIENFCQKRNGKGFYNLIIELRRNFSRTQGFTNQIALFNINRFDPYYQLSRIRDDLTSIKCSGIMLVGDQSISNKK